MNKQRLLELAGINEEVGGTHSASTKAAEIIFARAEAFLENEGKDDGYSIDDIVEEQLDVFVDEIRVALRKLNV